MKLINPLDIFKPFIFNHILDRDKYFDDNKRLSTKRLPSHEDEFLRRILSCLRTRPGEWEVGNCTIDYGDVSLWIANDSLSTYPQHFRVYRPHEIYLEGHPLFEDIRREVLDITLKAHSKYISSHISAE